MKVIAIRESENFVIILSLECKEFLDLVDCTFRLKKFQVTFSVKSFKFFLWDINCLSNVSFRFYCNSGQKQQSTILYDDSQSSSKNIFTWPKVVFCKCIGKNYLSV